MEQVRSGAIPYAKLDVLHLQTLQRILPTFGLDKIAPTVQDQLTLAWHKLDAWKDVPSGLGRLRRHYLLAPVSNGNIALMSDLARRNEFPWDAILGADLARNYKPAPEVYRAAVEAFNLQPSQCMMCAAHGGDLKAASENGLRRPSSLVRMNNPARAKNRQRSPSISARNPLTNWPLDWAFNDCQCSLRNIANTALGRLHRCRLDDGCMGTRASRSRFAISRARGFGEV